MKIQTLQINKLNLAGYNPRKDLQPGNAEYEKLKRFITEFGYVEPIIWNQQTGNVVGGHQRLKILQEMGITEVECVVVELDEQNEKALNVALNKVNGEWDIPLLNDLLKDLESSGFDVTLTGFDPFEINQLFTELDKNIKEDDFDVDKELAQPAITKQGDLWLLGRHQLVWGWSAMSIRPAGKYS